MNICKAVTTLPGTGSWKQLLTEPTNTGDRNHGEGLWPHPKEAVTDKREIQIKKFLRKQ